MKKHDFWEFLKFFFFLINHLFTYLNISIVANNNQIDYLINCITTANNNVKHDYYYITFINL